MRGKICGSAGQAGCLPAPSKLQEKTSLHCSVIAILTSEYPAIWLGTRFPISSAFMEPTLRSHRSPPPSHDSRRAHPDLGALQYLCFLLHTSPGNALCHHRVFPDIHSQLLYVTIILSHSTLYLSCGLPLSALNVLIYCL